MSEAEKVRLAEQQVLGAMLTSPVAINDATAILQPADFQEPRHELIFAAILQQAADGLPVDTIAVADRLGGDAKRAGGGTYLLELTGGLVAAASAEFYAGKVREASQRRKVREVGVRLESLGADDGDPLDVVNAARAELDALLELEVREDESNESAVYAAIESLDSPLGLPTPWREVTKTLGGWAPGMLTVIGARPSVGKSVLGVNCVLDMARRHQTAIMFSLEMRKNELYLRMLSDVGSVKGETLLHRATTEADDRRLAEAAAHIARLPLVVDDRTALSLAQMRAKIKTVQRDRQVGLVVVDYLSLVKPPPDAPRNDRRVQVDLIAQGLKNLARDTNVHIIALAQLNRGIESRAEKAPVLADLREAGGIEAAADNVILLHRATSPDHGDVTEMGLWIAKNRHGPLTRCPLVFEGQFSRAVDPFTINNQRTA